MTEKDTRFGPIKTEDYNVKVPYPICFYCDYGYQHGNEDWTTIGCNKSPTPEKDGNLSPTWTTSNFQCWCRYCKIDHLFNPRWGWKDVDKIMMIKKNIVIFQEKTKDLV